MTNTDSTMNQKVEVREIEAALWNTLEMHRLERQMRVPATQLETGLLVNSEYMRNVCIASNDSATTTSCGTHTK